jgi:hypothetical protein
MQYLASALATPRRLPEASIAKRLGINTVADFYDALWAYYTQAARQTVPQAPAATDHGG